MGKEKKITGVVSHIQRFSVHDGPGIRTTVFLKGCQMRCPWCHNPETYRHTPELQIFANRCIGCDTCVKRCKEGAIEVVDGVLMFHRDRCVGCGHCAETCYAGARVVAGAIRSAEEVFKEVLADREFYKSSGGVTISGGEPLVQPEFTRAILELCKQEEIHTTVETNLALPSSVLEPLLPLVDLFFVDIKLFDDAKHKKWTGISNKQTFENLMLLDRHQKPVVVRTPVIAGLNDQPEHIYAIASWLEKLDNVLRYDLLPYHPLGNGKYTALGYDPPPAWFSAPSSEVFEQLTTVARLVKEKKD